MTQIINLGGSILAVFIDLPKAFNTANHNILLSKLNTYGFSINFIKLLTSYLSNREQKSFNGTVSEE